MKTLSIIIPILNEENTIVQLLQKVADVDIKSIGYNKEIIIVDDGSTDSTPDLLKEFKTDHKDLKIILHRNKKNSGKGFSLKAGFKLATGDVMIIQDGDLEYDPIDYIDILKHMDENKLDIVYGSRITGIKKFENGYSTITFFLGGIFFSIMATILSFTRITDKWTCYKTFSKKTKKYLLMPEENGFDWEPAITMLLLRKGFSYGEVPIHYYPRSFEEGKKIKRRDGFIAVKTLLKRRFGKVGK